MQLVCEYACLLGWQANRCCGSLIDPNKICLSGAINIRNPPTPTFQDDLWLCARQTSSAYTMKVWTTSFYVFQVHLKSASRWDRFLGTITSRSHLPHNVNPALIDSERTSHSTTCLFLPTSCGDTSDKEEELCRICLTYYRSWYIELPYMNGIMFYLFSKILSNYENGESRRCSQNFGQFISGSQE